jgi:hypothetical protein
MSKLDGDSVHISIYCYIHIHIIYIDTHTYIHVYIGGNSAGDTDCAIPRRLDIVSV